MRNVLSAILIFGTTALVACGGAKGEDPGESYMPDMYFSRAYETYGYNNVEGELDSLKARGINYTGMPVPGTIARNDVLHHLTPDSSGLQQSKSMRNPLDTVQLTASQMREAERLYLVNCGICHGAKLDGNGPIYNGGNGAYPVQPRNLTDDYTKALTDGHIFYVITYGIRTMGSYASQLRPDQRWAVIKYIRSKQGVIGATAAGAASPTTAATDTTSNQ